MKKTPRLPCPWPSPQRHIVTTDNFQTTPGNMIEAYMEEQQGIAVWGPVKPWQSFHNVPDPRPWQATSLPRWQVRSADQSLHPPQQGISLLLPLAIFFLVLLHGSDLASLGASLDGAPRPSAPMRAMNLFCNCRSRGDAGAFLPVSDVINFRLPDLPFWVSPIPLQEAQTLSALHSGKLRGWAFEASGTWRRSGKPNPLSSTIQPILKQT